MLRPLLVLRPRGAREAGLVHRSQFEELVRSVYLSTHISRGFLGSHLPELY